MLVVRNVTEWPEAVKLGVARLVGAETASIVGAMRELLTDEAAFARWPPAGRLTARASAPCSVSGNGRRAPQRARRDDKISIGAALFVGAVRELLIDEAAYAEMAAGGSPYGDGYAAARISAVFGFGQRAAAGAPARLARHDPLPTRADGSKSATSPIDPPPLVFGINDPIRPPTPVQQ